MNEGWANPLTAGIEWEGIFSVPVCNIEKVVPINWKKKDTLQQRYGAMQMIQFCDSPCGLNKNETDTFIEAANMKNFKSIRKFCP